MAKAPVITPLNLTAKDGVNRKEYTLNLERELVLNYENEQILIPPKQPVKSKFSTA